MTTRRQVPRAPTGRFGQTVLFEGEIAYDQTLKRFRMGDGTTPGGVVVPTIADTALALAPLPGFYGQITGGTNRNNSYLMVIDGAVLIRPGDGALKRAANLNLRVRIAEPGPAPGGRDTHTGLSAHEMGYVWLIGNSATGENALIASTAESHLNVAKPPGWDFIAPYPVCAYLSDVGSNLRNMLIYGRRHRFVKTQDGNSNPIVASGVAGDPAKGAYASVSVAGYVPKQAHTVLFSLSGFAGLSKLSPDPDYDGVSGFAFGLPYTIDTSNRTQVQQAEVQLEDYFERTVFYASNDPHAKLGIYGFTLSFGSLGG